ncbi:MAG: aminotransferase class I/II-fold pyridoxal phosphate-dependent enzyme [Candidatus Eisenbacteria bacterium]
MSEFIPLSIPNISGNEWDYVRECLSTGWVSSAGRYVMRFEQDLARYVGAQHAVACASGTAALHTALLLLGARGGDVVLAPSLTFIAPINAVRYCGAEPVFFGADRFFNLDPAGAREYLAAETEQRDGQAFETRTGRPIRALLSVAVFGNAGDWSELYADCRRRGIAILEDATEAMGTRYTAGAWSGRHAGAAADMVCFSFNGNKIITTGGGGMIATDSDELARRARYLTQQAKDDPIAYVHDEIGYNYRLTNIAAAIGVAQLERIEEFVAIKQANYAAYRERLAALAWCELQPAPEYARNNLWMYALRIREGRWRDRARALVDALAAQGVETRPLWHPSHLQKPYRECRSFGVAHLPELVANTINLPCSTNLQVPQIDRICEVLARV